MRIVHTCLRYPPATGGVERYVEEIVERTRNIDLGRDVRVLTSKMRTHGPISDLNSQLLISDPPYIQRLHYVKTPLISYPRLSGLNYYIGHHQPDIIHGHSFWYQPADVAAKYAMQMHIPFIFNPYYYETSVRKKAWWQIYKRTIGYATFRAAEIVVVISPYEQSLITKAGFSVKRFELIPPGVDVKRFSSPKINPYFERGIRGRILLSVARIAEEKGLQDVIEILPIIIRRFPDLHYIIVGEDFGYKDNLMSKIQRLGLQKKVKFFDKLSSAELVGAFYHADLFIHPSHYEAFGIVLAEALAAGTAVVARNGSAIPHVVPDGLAGRLFNNPEELASIIMDLLNNPNRIASMGIIGKKHVTSNFSWNASLNKMTKLYDELGRQQTNT